MTQYQKTKLRKAIKKIGKDCSYIQWEVYISVLPAPSYHVRIYQSKDYTDRSNPVIIAGKYDLIRSGIAYDDFRVLVDCGDVKDIIDYLDKAYVDYIPYKKWQIKEMA